MKLTTILACSLLLTHSSSAALQATTSSATDETSITPSNTDLATNAIITRTAGSVFSGINSGNPNQLNNGSTNNGDGLFHSSGTQGNHFPATYTIDLDIATNPLGYNITGIDTFAGWSENGRTLANQKYQILYRLVGSSTYTPLTTQTYTPFNSGTGASGSRISLADSTGTIASGVDSIRFIIQDHAVHTGPAQGTVFKEFDIIGTPVPNPLSITSPTNRTIIQRNAQNTASIPITGAFAGSPERIEARVIAQPHSKNLGNIWFIGDSITQSNADGDSNGSPRKSLHDLLLADNYTFNYTGHFSANTDGLSGNEFIFHSGVSGSCIGANSNNRTNMTANIPSWWNGTRLANNKPNIVLIMLGTNDIDLNDASSTAPNRIKLLVDTIFNQVGPSDPTPAIYVAQIPPNRGSVAENNRVLAYNAALPAIVNTLVSEGKDVTLVDQYTPIDANKDAFMRDTLHTNTAGNGVLAQQWFNAIDARFDVPPSGSSTDWQTIDNTPTGNTYSGTLQNIQAGGWYQLQVRSIVSGNQDLITNTAKIGVGDIFVIAGQSNSANHGSPALTTTDDRVSVRSSLTNNLWQTASDPLPIATGNGGSVWTRFGNLYTASENIPVGFINVGVGGTSTSQWLPASNNLYPRIRSAVQSFPNNGFKAILWHQGESDAIANLTASAHQSNLETIIAQSRTDSGWNTPWYIAEASYLPTTSLTRELRITAGQRNTAYADPLTFVGPRTDDFHLENKTHDGVHFNATGLLDHANQWHKILTGNPDINILNPNIESNTPLGDGAIAATSITSNTSPSVIAYQILAASGTEAADGSNGYYNPNANFYTNTTDTINSGIAPNMSGPHIAFLVAGTAGNHFLQTLRTNLEPNTTYNLTVAIGRRTVTEPGIFSDVKIEILANGQPVGTPVTISESDLTADAFTNVTTTHTTPDSQAPNETLSVRITKLTGGVNTYTDFDNIRLTSSLTPFGTWQQNNFSEPNSTLAKKNADPDIDGIPNIIEYFLGTSPLTNNSLPNPTVTTTDGTINIPLESSITDPGLELKYSLDLINWHKVTTPAHPGVTNNRTPSNWSAQIPLTTSQKAFFHLTVE